MKKLLFALLCLCYSSLYAQFDEEAYERNNIIITGGIGGCVGYSYQQYSLDNLNNNYYSSGTNINFSYNIGYTLPVTLEYAISNKFGVGASYSNSTYINSSSSKTKINNFGAFGAFHFVSKQKIEMYVRLNGGLSSGSFQIPNNGYYSYNTSSYIYNDYLIGDMKGWFVKPSYGLRVYFTKNIGMFADIGIGIYSIHSNTLAIDNATYDVSNSPVRLVMVGAEVSTGIAVKF